VSIIQFYFTTVRPKTNLILNTDCFILHFSFLAIGIKISRNILFFATFCLFLHIVQPILRNPSMLDLDFWMGLAFVVLYEIPFSQLEIECSDWDTGKVINIMQSDPAQRHLHQPSDQHKIYIIKERSTFQMLILILILIPSLREELLLDLCIH
jgi:hypothetical protein